MRLLSTRMFMVFLPPAAAGFGWVCEQNVHVSAVCVMLFLSGFFSMYVVLSLVHCAVIHHLCSCIYSSTLAYIVDSNAGRSSSAVALNSCFRGFMGFVAAEIAVPLQVSLPQRPAWSNCDLNFSSTGFNRRRGPLLPLGWSPGHCRIANFACLVARWAMERGCGGKGPG